MVNKLFLDKVNESFFIMSMDLLHLFILLFTCSSKSSLESKTNTKCFWLLADWTSWLLNCNGGYVQKEIQKKIPSLITQQNIYFH